MSAAWMKANGMRDNSNLSELAKRKDFGVANALDHDEVVLANLPPPTPSEWAQAAGHSLKEVVKPVTMPARAVKRGFLSWFQVDTEPKILNPEAVGVDADIEDPANMGWWWNLRVRLFGHKRVVMMSIEEIEKLGKVDSTQGEIKYQGRWDQAYMTHWLPLRVRKFLFNVGGRSAQVLHNVKLGWLRLKDHEK